MAARDTSTVEPPRPARKLRRGPLTRQQILDAALTLFSQKGAARASVRDIAQAAGITDAAIYYHFPSKRELFEALIEERGFDHALQELEAAEVTIGPAEAIPRMARGALELMHANHGFMKVLMAEAMAEDPVAVEEYRMLTERWERALVRILGVYATQGMLPLTEVGAVAKQVIVTIIGAYADHLMSPQPTANGEVPAELHRQVDAAMRQIAQGLTHSTR